MKSSRNGRTERRTEKGPLKSTIKASGPKAGNRTPGHTARGQVPRLKAARQAGLKVEWTDVGSVPIPKPRELAALATRVLRAEGQKGTVNLVFCEDSLVRKLNRQFRTLDKVTDVLSFHYGEDEDDPEGVWGEIYIASTQAQKQAPRWKNTFSEELRRLVVHGALHLAGYDHMKAKERLTMRALEDHYLTHGK